MTESRPRVLVRQLERWAQIQPEQPAIHGRGPDGRWRTFSWGAYWTAARETAKGLIALGHQAGQCVAIVGANRPEWVICQFGIMAAGGMPAPSYPTNTPEQVAHILRNSEAPIAIADTRALLDQYRAALALDEALKVEHLITMLPGEDPEATSLDALRALGREQDDAELDRRLADLTDQDPCLLIYTSGTTGVAKGVMLDGGGITAMTESLLAHASVFAEDPSMFRSVSYLPLCHVAEQLLTNFMQMGTGGQVFFCSEMAQIKDHLVEVRPTLFAAVPRVWEKLQAALEAKLNAARGYKGLLARWARRTEQAAIEREMASGRSVDTLGRRLADRLVISKIKAAIGLDQVRLAGTAAAPISVGTLRFFASLGIPIYEAYGMSETSGIVTLNPIGRARFGTVGVAVPNVEVRVAGDGEVLCRGRNMTRGYLRMPEQTAELIDEQGWVHTGDLGTFDEQGYLTITGRKKDILITAGGKNVAPAEMEGHINQIPGVGQVVVVGDRRPYLCALITLDPENLPELAAAAGVPAASLEAMAADERVRAHLQQRIEVACNQKVARYQTVKRIALLPAELSVEGGELTPTMKVRRQAVTEKYASTIAALYEPL